MSPAVHSDVHICRQNIMSVQYTTSNHSRTVNASEYDMKYTQLSEQGVTRNVASCLKY